MKTVKRILEMTCSLGITLFLGAAIAGAQDLTWPVTTDLVARDWTRTDYQPWVKVGDVKVWNTRDDLTIEIVPGRDASGAPFMLKEVSFYAANTPEFSAILDLKGKPAPALFPYKTDYLTDAGAPAASHREELPVSMFGLCWGTAEKCPLDRYLVVHAELMMKDADGQYVAVREPAFAGAATGSVADTAYLTPFLDKKGLPIGWYVTYPFAKVETGHFVDARVKGLGFVTPTQWGTSSDSGNFFYIPPERVDFFVGSLKLGGAVGDHTVTPIDLFPGSDLDDDRVLNVARLLQTLDSNDHPMLIDVTASISCLESALASLGLTAVDFGDDDQVDALLSAASAGCGLVPVSKAVARANLDQGQQAANILKTNVSKNAGMMADKAKIEIMPFYVPAKRADDTSTNVVYHDAAGNVLETRGVAKPLVVVYEEEVEGTAAVLDGASARDVFIAISRDDGSTWKRRNISKTAGRSSLGTAAGVAAPGLGDANKPMLSVKDNLMLLAWTSKYCHGGRPAYSIRRFTDRDCDANNDGSLDGVLKITHEGKECVPDYPYDDAYWQDDLYGVGGPQRSVLYEDDWAVMGEVPYSCVWTARGKIEADGSIVWFKPEKITSGRRDAMQLTSAAAEDAGVAIAWQEDPKGLQPPSEYGPGDGWSGANTSNKTDIWYSFLRWSDFDTVDTAYVPPDNKDIVDTDPEMAGRLKALVPFSLPVKISDNDVCSLENILALGGEAEDHEDHLFETPGLGTHRYCGTAEGVGTGTAPGTNPLCAFTVPIPNHNGVTHNVCVTKDDNLADTVDARRVLDGNTGASRPNLFLQPYAKADGSKGAWAMLAYEESKGMGTPPEVEGEDEEDRYKADLGKNVVYHSFDYTAPESASGGGILNMPETDATGAPVFAVDESNNVIVDALGRPQLAYENARRVRLLHQPKSKVGASKTVLVALWRQGEEGHGKAADIFTRRIKASTTGNPYAFVNFVPGAQNVSSVTPGETRIYQVEDPGTGARTSITKMVNWSWGTGNLSDKSGTEPYSDAKAHRGALNGDELVIAYTWTPNWGRLANDKYDLYIRRSWDGGQTWKTDPNGSGPIEHTIVFVDPETKEETVTITSYAPGVLEPPRNVSNLRNNRISVLEPRLVKTPGDIKKPDGTSTGYAEDVQNKSVYQVAWGLQVSDPGSQAEDPDDESPSKMPLDIYYGRTTDKGQHYESVIVTKGDGSGKPEESWNLLAKDKPEQAGAQLKQTPDGSRMYAVWVERDPDSGGGDIMFRRVDYRPAPLQ